MELSYPAEDLDQIVRAALEFKEIAPGDSFFSGNIEGRAGLEPASDGSVKKKLLYIAALPVEVIVYLGPGTDGVDYFDTGPRARAFMAEGGFAGYAAGLRRQRRARQTSTWAPILISLLALVVSTLTWLIPSADSARIDALRRELDSLKQQRSVVEQAVMPSPADTAGHRTP